MTLTTMTMKKVLRGDANTASARWL